MQDFHQREFRLIEADQEGWTGAKGSQKAGNKLSELQTIGREET